ncbi:MAG: acyltransferase [Solirubrobacteraceae bacterium]
MSSLRRRWATFRNPLARVEIDGSAYLGPRFSLNAPYGGSFSAGPGVEFRRGFLAELGGPDARISIGAGSVLTYEVILQCSHSIEIGEQCSLGQAALIADSRQPLSSDGLAAQRAQDTQDTQPTGVKIFNHASISAKCTVIADVGEHSFVGANSAVTKPLPARCVAAGVPARLLEFFDDDAAAERHSTTAHASSTTTPATDPYATLRSATQR